MTDLAKFFDRLLRNPPRPATPAEARPDGSRVFPNVPCMTADCAGDLGHEGDCGPRPVES